MAIVVILIFILGFLLSLVGGLWGLVLAFQDSAVWGLLYLFIPFAALVFFILRWSNPNVRKAFLLNLGGFLLSLLAVVFAPALMTRFLPLDDATFDAPPISIDPTAPVVEVPSPDIATEAPGTAPATVPNAALPVDPTVQYDYTQSMEVGYAAFDQRDYQTALINFRRALQARPGDRYATDAIANTEAILNRN